MAPLTVKKNGIIDEVFSLEPIQAKITNAPNNTLVIFDIDDVIILSSNSYNYNSTISSTLWEKIKNTYSKEKVRFLESLIIAKKQYCLLDPEIINIFAKLKLFKLPTIGLTAISTGAFGIIRSMENFRISKLKKIGIDFLALETIRGKLYANNLAYKNMVFPDCIGVPLLKSGIIFTAGVDKGIVLEYILKSKNYYPDNIIFIDDCLNNLHSVLNCCVLMKIGFYGFHYRAASLMCSERT